MLRGIGGEKAGGRVFQIFWVSGLVWLCGLPKVQG